MTARQEAYRLIDGLSEDNVRLMVILMTKIAGNQTTDVPNPVTGNEISAAEKIRAFYELQESRKSAGAHGFSDFEAEREAATKEEYGSF